MALIAADGAATTKWIRTVQRAVSTHTAIWTLFVVAVCTVVLAPVLALQARAFDDSFAGFKAAMQIRGIGDSIRNTVYLGVGSVAIAVVVGTATAWAAASLTGWLRRLLSPLPLIPLLIPPVASVAGWAFLLSPTVGYINQMLRATPLFDHLSTGPIDVYSVTWIVLITGVILSAYVYLFVSTGLREIGPDYFMAAQVSGASTTRTFFTVVLPLLRPAITYSAAIVLLLGLGQFSAPLILGRQQGIDVLTTEMWKLTQNYPIDYSVGAALGTPLIILGIAVVVLQKKIIGAQDKYLLTGAKLSSAPSRGGGIWAAGLIFTYGSLTSFLPIAALLYVSLSPYWGPGMSLSGLTLTNYIDFFTDPFAMDAVWTSVRVSAIAVAVLLPVGSLCAWGLLRKDVLPGWLAWILDITVSIPVAVAASILGFGILFIYTRPPLVLYGTEAVLVITYFTLMIPFVSRLMTTTLMSIGDEYFQASRVSGAGILRTLLQVVVPLIRGGLGAATAITIVLLIHEFSASLMVRSPSTQVMGSLLYDEWAGGIYPRAAVIALLMVLVTALGLLVAALISGRNPRKDA